MRLGLLLPTSLLGMALYAAEPWQARTIAGTGKAGYSGDQGPALQAELNNPFGVVRGPDGSLYICDTGNHAIRRIDGKGMIHTVAGTGKPGYAGDGGPAREALLFEPYEVRFDRDGNLFFVEMRNHIVRRVERTSGLITTVAGTGKPGFAGDHGPAMQAEMKQPHSIQFGPEGDLYICDIGNHRIRRVNLEDGHITTFAGTGGRDPTADGAPREGTALNGPRAIDFDSTGQLWLALREGNAVYVLDAARKTWRHAAGNGRKGFTGNDGPAINAALNGPKGISIGPDGWVHLADTESHTVRSLEPGTGKLRHLGGTGKRGDGPDGPGTECGMARPHGVYADRDGKVYIGDSEAHRVRVLIPAGE